MSATSVYDPLTPSAPRSRPLLRWAPLTGFAFVVLFLVSVAASSPPADGASDAKWLASYTGTGHKAGHVITGVCLALAGLCLVTFITALWMRVADARRSERISPLPVVAAGVAAACMAVGGGLMGVAISVSSAPSPDANILRICNNAGFTMVALGGMLAAALSLAVISRQARVAGMFGRRLEVFGYVVAMILLASLLFAPIVALLAWLVVVAIRLLREAKPAI
jgi:uncharacterized membrane protein YjfL (UPF0719 family)